MTADTGFLWPGEVNLAIPKKDYLGHPDILLLHRLGGDPQEQDAIRIWDYGVRLKPGGQAVYLGQIANEVLVQRMQIFSYWHALPDSRELLEQLKVELANLQVIWGDETLLIIRETQESSGS